MASKNVHIQPQTITRVSDSAHRLGTTLAEKQLGLTQQAYRQHYNRGISQFWVSRGYDSEQIGEELAELRMQVQRRFALVVGRTVLTMGVLPGLVAWWAFGAVAGVILLFISVGLGFYFGSK